jgi:hypothetical protein
MSVKNFKFVSPGVFINEIDNSFIPRTADVIGPVVIGRAERGQGLRPVKVDSFSQFVENFGYPIAGGAGDDISRQGNYVGPTYGPFAAQAYLRSNVGPVTFVRLMGAQHDDYESSAGEAGWKLEDASTTAANNGGAYGLLVIPSSSTTTVCTGTLAAVWYLKQGYNIVLSGSIRGHSTGSASTLTGSAAWFHSDTDALDTDNNTFTVIIQDSTADTPGQILKTNFNFNDNSEKFIRHRFNTNPQLTNTTITATDNREKYWLGETYENQVRKLGLSGSMLGAIVAIQSGSSGYHTNQQSYQNAVAGWFIGQDLTTDFATFNPNNNSRAPQLFRLHGLENGEWMHKNVKVSIERIKRSTSKNDRFGSFSVVLRNLRDNDNAVKVIERFDNCNLDPSSPNYVARRIGDQYYTWSEGERRLRLQGDFRNQSKFIRVEVANSVAEGSVDPIYLPFGYYGPAKPRDFLLMSGNLTAHAVGFPAYDASGSFPGTFLEMPGAPQGTGYHFIKGVGEIAEGTYAHIKHVTSTKTYAGGADVHLVNPFNLRITASINFPAAQLRVSASDATMGSLRKAYFGFQTGRDRYSTTYDESTPEALRALPAGLTATSTGMEYSHTFTLDDIVRKGNDAEYASGSRVAGTSCTAVSSSYEGILDAGYDKFTAPFAGGFDGFDITEAEPLRNSGFSTTTTQTNNYAFNTVKRAIDTVADPEFVEMNLLTVPGLTNAQLTTHLMNVCEDRGDALAVIDIENVYTADTEGTESITERKGTVSNAVSTLRSRGLDSSYGCTFYPWVQIKDETSGRIFWVPPSVPMLGVFASSEAKSELWFAPAGFNRGGLSQGAAGLPVLSVSDRLTSKDRDKLYEANINPIASFPSNGIVVFGQKTLQDTQSALDRINVRRLTIYLKKQISRMATRVLFDQNVEATWNRFIALVEPFLANTKARFGISEYRLILDESTTTPDLIDQNILYAKIMIKPTRAIEFIAIDFVVASTGASFDD